MAKCQRVKCQYPGPGSIQQFNIEDTNIKARALV